MFRFSGLLGSVVMVTWLLQGTSTGQNQTSDTEGRPNTAIEEKEDQGATSQLSELAQPEAIRDSGKPSDASKQFTPNELPEPSSAVELKASDESVEQGEQGKPNKSPKPSESADAAAPISKPSKAAAAVRPHVESELEAHGIQVKPVPQLVRMHLPHLLTKGVGLLVVNVKPLSAAHQADVRSGDLILEVDGAPIRDLNTLERTLKNTRVKWVTLTVVQEGTLNYVRLGLAGERSPQAGDSEPVSAESFSVSTPAGHMAVTGVNGHYKISAKYRNRDGRLEHLKTKGTRDEIGLAIQQMPEELRSLLEDRFSE